MYFSGECVEDKVKDTSTDVSIERDKELCKVNIPCYDI
jgi:hypothetical protein